MGARSYVCVCAYVLVQYVQNITFHLQQYFTQCVYGLYSTQCVYGLYSTQCVYGLYSTQYVYGLQNVLMSHIEKFMQFMYIKICSGVGGTHSGAGKGLLMLGVFGEHDNNCYC